MKVPASDRHVNVRNRSDGLTELTPKLPALDFDERWMVIVTVTIASWGFYLAGKMPAPVLAAVMTACLVGDLALGARAVVRALLRPPAKVIKIRTLERHRRRG
jgi:hypothetical protein